MHKAHELGFDLATISDGMGSAPLPPPAGDFLTAMGRSNDAILFAAAVEPDCKILRLSHLTRRWWWGGRYKTRRYNAHPVIGPEI